MQQEELRVLMRALRLYINVHNYVLDSEVGDTLVAADLLIQFKELDQAIVSKTFEETSNG